MYFISFSKVPPVIIETMTSNDMVVREGTNVTLMCKARGYPEPYVSKVWYPPIAILTYPHFHMPT